MFENNPPIVAGFRYYIQLEQGKAVNLTIDMACNKDKSSEHHTIQGFEPFKSPMNKRDPDATPKTRDGGFSSEAVNPEWHRLVQSMLRL